MWCSNQTVEWWFELCKSYDIMQQQSWEVIWLYFYVTFYGFYANIFSDMVLLYDFVLLIVFWIWIIWTYFDNWWFFQQYDREMNACDPDQLAGLVLEVVPGNSCLVFCPTKKNCENVAQLLCKMFPKFVHFSFWKI